MSHFRAIQRDLPWRRTRDPYAIWISEIMLQQTRVAAVVPYYDRWMARFPTVRDLALAELDEVLALWAGLGYYSRARNLHRCAGEILARHDGAVPSSVATLRSLPGIGRYTAGAIASIAFGRNEPVVDGNVARVLSRIYAIELDIRSTAGQRVLWDLAATLVPADAAGDFNQGIMELGATVCTPARPRCLLCPVRELCQARQSGRQDVLPVRRGNRPASDLPLIDASALWITRRNQVLLGRRAPHGLYGGLWELPQTEDASQLENLLPAGSAEMRPSRRLASVRLTSSEPLLEHHQILSHRQLRIRVFRAIPTGALVLSMKRCSRPSPYDALAWQARETLDAIGLSSATRTIIDQIVEKHGWNASRKRSNTSPQGSDRSSQA